MCLGERKKDVPQVQKQDYKFTMLALLAHTFAHVTRKIPHCALTITEVHSQWQMTDDRTTECNKQLATFAWFTHRHTQFSRSHCPDEPCSQLKICTVGSLLCFDSGRVCLNRSVLQRISSIRTFNKNTCLCGKKQPRIPYTLV